MGVLEDWADRWKNRTGDNVEQPRRSLTAAGARVDLSKPASNDTKREQWQIEAWAYRDKVPELRFAGEFVASSLGRLKVFPAENRPRGEDPVPLETASRRQQRANEVGVDEETIEAAIACVERLNLNGHGASLLGRIAENLEFAGQCYLLGERNSDANTGESWSVRSVLECTLTQSGGQVWDDEGMAPRTLKNEDCDLMKLWTPHPAYFKRPDSVVRSVLDTVEDMWAVAARGRARNKSRIGAGKVFFLPSEATMARPGGAPISADLPGSFEDGEQDPLMQAIIEYVSTPVIDQSDVSSIAPMILRLPAMLNDRPLKDLIGTIDLHSGVDAAELTAQYESLVMRLARGMNLAPERITGLGDTNNWQANVITADEVANAITPRAERICDSLTAAYLDRQLRSLGIPAEQRSKVCLWFDPSELVQNPNRGEDAQTLYNSGELSGEALRRYRGFSEDDAPSNVERALRAITTERLAGESVPVAIKLLSGQLPSLSDLTALEEVRARLQARAVVDATPNRLPTPPAARPGLPVPKPDPTPPVGQRTQPATANQPGALGASAGRDQSGKFAGAETARQWRLDRKAGRKLTEIDRALVDRILALAEGSVGRAVEKAANRIRSDAVKTGRGGEFRDPLAAAAFPKGTDPRTVLASGGSSLARLSDAGQVDALITAAVDDLEPQFLAEVTRAAEAADEVLDGLLASGVTAAAPRSMLVERVKRNAAAAWRWLSGKLRDHARRVLYGGYTPSRDGEASPGIVPASLVRGAVAQAGGLPERSAGVRDDGTSAGEPLGGVATGEVALDKLRVSGGLILAREWQYPAIPRQGFLPHKRLDGVVFEEWTDPQLKVADGDGWLGTEFYHPLDHAGCLCTWAPIAVIGMTEDADPNGDEVAELRRKVLS